MAVTVDGYPPEGFCDGETVSGWVVMLYAAVCNSDDMEGKGKDIDRSYHLTERAATIGASGIGVMGGDGKVELRPALAFNDGRYMLFGPLITIAVNEAAEAELRKKALAKLTPAERAALLGTKE